MIRKLVVFAVLCGLVAGCSTSWRDSNANPSNWFRSNDRPETLVPIEEELVIDNRPLVARVSSVNIDETPGGIIVRATGLPPETGFWQGSLVLEQRDGKPVDGLLSFVFRVAPPFQSYGTGTERTREITVARFISNQQLQGVETIRIVAEQNTLSANP